MHSPEASSSLSRNVRIETDVKGWLESFLPDEIVINVLSRLHVKDVLRCRCVVKRWRDLTMTQHFVDLHKRHGTVQTVLHDKAKVNGSHSRFFIDEWWLPPKKKSSFQKFHSYPLYNVEFSLDGLVVMLSSCSHVVLIVNPITGENVRIFMSEWKIRRVCGVYFNPILKEHCALFKLGLEPSVSDPDPGPPIAYKILTLGPNPYLTDIKNQWYLKDRFCYFERKCPVLVDEFLYWLVAPEEQYEDTGHGDIIEFNIRSAEFKLMQYPVPVEERTDYDHGQIGLDLLKIDGFLNLLLMSRGGCCVDIDVWTLQDRASESWARSYETVSDKAFPDEKYLVPEAIALKNDYDEKILIRSDEKLYVCDLVREKARVHGKKKYNDMSSFCSHDMCFTSLKNCKPEIYIGGRRKCKFCDRLDKEENRNSNSEVSVIATSASDDSKKLG